jgi:hypothetical protein
MNGAAGSPTFYAVPTPSELCSGWDWPPGGVRGFARIADVPDSEENALPELLSIEFAKSETCRVATLSRQALDEAAAHRIVLHPARRDAERSELKRAFCSSLSEL